MSLPPSLLAELVAVQADISRLAIRLLELSRRLDLAAASEARDAWAVPPEAWEDRYEGSQSTDCPPTSGGPADSR